MQYRKRYLMWALLVSALNVNAQAQAATTPPTCVDPWAAFVYPATTGTSTVTPLSDASRFLNMASFGANGQDINHLSKMTIAQWLDEQFAMKAACHLAFLNETQNNNDRNNRIEVWFRLAVTAPDQLRQRVAFALSELFVVSDVGSSIPANALAVYYDILIKNAFGNFRDLLQEVTLSPAMGRYLSMLGNQRANKATGIRADENYAREIMQLFTIGLTELDTTGVALLQNKLPIATYNQTDVENLARVFTGWTWGDSYNFTDGDDWRINMKAFPSYHDRANKTIINQTLIPANAKPETDLTLALNTLFKHPNVGPFVSRRLIQRLVTSNPSPEYIGRVAAVFNNNGQGVRGDLKAVIKAILLDTEALTGSKANKNFGKLREPLLVVTHLWRAFNGQSIEGTLPYYYPEGKINQAPLSSPSVFNFFTPDYATSGYMASNKLVAPEFQLVNEANNTRFYNELYGLIQYGNNFNSYADPHNIQIDIKPLVKRANSPADLVSYLNLLLTNGKMSTDMQGVLKTYIHNVTASTRAQRDLKRSVDALYLVMSSPYYLIQR
ncbi:MAG: DUF1800 domain-containing protein [Methylococcaceae bacterium]